jgi:hypothetical protein
MDEFHSGEIRKLKRERGDIDRTIADFERLEARAAVKSPLGHATTLKIVPNPTSRTPARGFGTAWKKLLERPESHDHLVQLFGADKQALAANVGQYLRQGQKRGDGLFVIATARNLKSFRDDFEKHGADWKGSVQSGQLILLDAQETLLRFVVGGQPDWPLFKNVIEAAMGRVRPRTRFSGLRAYGEMVGILWLDRQYAAAIRLEQFWNRLLSRSSFTLFCGYAVDVFGRDFQSGPLEALLGAHTHLLPSTNGDLTGAINLAMDEALGSSVRELRSRIKANFRYSRAALPFGEAMALFLRNNLPEQADHILDLARRHYHSRQSEL